MIKKFLIVIIFLFLFVKLPIVSPLSLVVHVPEKYTDVSAGERFYFEIEIKYPENPKRKDLRLEYEIVDQDGNMISQAKALKAVETQASFIDFLVIPESTKTGIYFINVKVKDYELLSEEISATFHVVGKQTDQIKIYFITILGVVVLVGVLVVVKVRK